MPKLVPRPTSQPDSLERLPTHLQQAVSTFSQAAYAERTRHAYQRAWRQFSTWCAQQNVRNLPAEPHVIAAWMAAHAAGIECAQWSRNSIALGLAAIVAVHRAAGYDLDRAHPLVHNVFKGASRRLALERPLRQAAPLMRDDLVAILSILGKRPRDLRDAALLSLGWCAALRGAELVGLDWGDVREGTGALHVGDDGLEVRLLVSKSSGGRPQSLCISRREAPSAYEAICTWVAVSQRQRRDPLFTSVNRHSGSGSRLTTRSLSRIVQGRMLDRLLAQGFAHEEALTRSKLFSAHSLRAGFVTSAVAIGVPEGVIRQRTRHRSMAVLQGYVRGAALDPGPLEKLSW